MTPTLGGKKRPFNKVDYQIESLTGSAVPTPDTFSSPVPIIYNQAKFGTCGGHAGAQLANILFNATTSPKFLWKIIKTFDGYGLNDGTDMPSIFKALKNFGVCDYSLMPNPDDYNSTTIEQYSDINEVTQAMRDNASLRKINNFAYTNRPTLAQIRDAIFQYKCAILLVDCGDGFWLPNWLRQSVIPLHVGNFVGHHFMCATAFGLTFVDGANSWSVPWAETGMFEFLQDFVPHVLEMGVATLAPVHVGYQFNKNLYLGMTDSDVHILQVKLGMPVQYQTGFFGFRTLAAVIAYQKAHGITATGFVGPLTRASLNSS